VRWRTLTETKVPDILQFVTEATRNGQEVHVGTDSLQTGRFTQFCTVVIVHTPGKGGRVAYSREVIPRITSLRERLQKEVWASVTVALLIAPTVPGRLSVHIDANPEPRHRSSQFVQELVGMVMGQGFRAVIKPDSYAASHAADWIVRHMGRMPRAS
jgi:predicted RNase H-related nuclease YkuK (DUF458 family)